jgi:hypothetical protein
VASVLCYILLDEIEIHRVLSDVKLQEAVLKVYSFLDAKGLRGGSSCAPTHSKELPRLQGLVDLLVACVKGLVQRLCKKGCQQQSVNSGEQRRY